MWTVPTLSAAEALPLLEAVRDRKRAAATKATLASAWSGVEARIAAFDKAWPTIARLPADPTYAAPPKPATGCAAATNPQREALLSLWDETLALGTLKQRIRDIHVKPRSASCPYCGVSEPLTFDHQLDKKDFPEFVAYARNLVPACGTCNSLKGTQQDVWLPAVEDPSGLPPLITVDLEREGAALVARFGLMRPHEQRSLGERVVTTCERLELPERWQSKAIEDLDRQRATVNGLLQSGCGWPIIQSAMQTELKSWVATYGNNYYGAALRQGVLARWSLFVDWVES